MIALIVCFFAALASAMTVSAFFWHGRAEHLEQRVIDLGSTLACRGARISDLLALGGELANDNRVLREACAHHEQRINNLLDLARVQDARIAEHLRTIELTQRYCGLHRSNLIYPN